MGTILSAEVAASPNLTGVVAFGGDSVLEYSSGSIESTSEVVFVFDDLLTTGTGKVAMDFKIMGLTAGMVVSPDESIYMAGSTLGDGYEGNVDFILVRYDNNGNLDTTFGNSSKVTTDFGNPDFLTCVAIQTDGKIVLAGNSQRPGNPSGLALARYNSDGSLDTSFSLDGKVAQKFGQVSALAIQKDGKIIVAGTDDNANFALCRYLSNGTPDPAFDDDGSVNTLINSMQGARASDIQIQSDGKILVSGSSNGYFTLVRYNSGGSLDNTFGGDGIILTDIGYWNEGKCIALQPDGKILLSVFSDGYMSLLRYDTNGNLDSSFNGTGTVKYDFIEAQSIVVQVDGKVVVAGSSSTATFALIRFNANGIIDSTFGENGIATADFVLNSPYDIGLASSLSIDGNGKIIAGGVFSPDGGGTSEFALARFNSNGTLDQSFGMVGSQGMIGTTGNDVFYCATGNDVIDGAGGIDVVNLPSLRHDYTIGNASLGFVVEDLVGSGGIDSVINVERLQFSDKKIALDLTPEGHAGQAMEFIGAVAPDLLNNTAVRGTIISLFDQGQTMESLSQLALDLNLLPTNSNVALANAVYHNVLGGPASAEMTSALVGYIEDHGQANFVATVAGLHINVDLVGLLPAGVEYLI